MLMSTTSPIVYVRTFSKVVKISVGAYLVDVKLTDVPPPVILVGEITVYLTVRCGSVVLASTQGD